MPPPYYQIQVKAVARKADWNKIVFAFLRNALAVGTTVIPVIFDGAGGPATVSAGFLGYLVNQVFEYYDNQDTRKELSNLKQMVKALLTYYFEWDKLEFSDPNNIPRHFFIPGRAFAPTWSVSDTPQCKSEHGYRLINPFNPGNAGSGKSKSRMFGLYPRDCGIRSPVNYLQRYSQDLHLGYAFYDFIRQVIHIISSTFVFWFIHFLLASASFATALTQSLGVGDKGVNTPLGITALVTAALVALLVPYGQHFTISNLERASVTYKDIIFALQSRTTIPGEGKGWVTDKEKNYQANQFKDIKCGTRLWETLSTPFLFCCIRTTAGTQNLKEKYKKEGACATSVHSCGLIGKAICCVWGIAVRPAKGEKVPQDQNEAGDIEAPSPARLQPRVDTDPYQFFKAPRTADHPTINMTRPCRTTPNFMVRIIENPIAFTGALELKDNHDLGSFKWIQI